jgi:hypothetical protein
MINYDYELDRLAKYVHNHYYFHDYEAPVDRYHHDEKSGEIVAKYPEINKNKYSKYSIYIIHPHNSTVFFHLFLLFLHHLYLALTVTKHPLQKFTNIHTLQNIKKVIASMSSNISTLNSFLNIIWPSYKIVIKIYTYI